VSGYFAAHALLSRSRALRETSILGLLSSEISAHCSYLYQHPQGRLNRLFESDLHYLDGCLCFCYNLKYRQSATIPQAQFTQFLQTAATPDFHFKISGFLAAIKLTDKSGYPDNGSGYANTISVLVV